MDWPIVLQTGAAVLGVLSLPIGWLFKEVIHLKVEVAKHDALVDDIKEIRASLEKIWDHLRGSQT